MYIVNFEGLAQASAAEVVWPLLDAENQPFASIAAAKFGMADLNLTIGAGLRFENSSVVAELTNARTENLVGVIPYEMWIQVGADKIAVVRGTMNFNKTKVRI